MIVSTISTQADDWDCPQVRVAAHVRDQFEAVHAGQREVGHDQVRNVGAEPFERVLSVGSGDDLEFDPEKLGVHMTGIRVILNEKHTRNAAAAFRLSAGHQ